MSIIRLLFGFLDIIAIVGIIYGGLMMMTSGGGSEKSSGKQKVAVAGIVGLVIIFSTYGIASFVTNQLITETGAN